MTVVMYARLYTCLSIMETVQPIQSGRGSRWIKVGFRLISATPGHRMRGPSSHAADYKGSASMMKRSSLGALF
ncbi:hypothetical protein [Paenibacillus sp. GCM10028914]|uniref:hypothetical protein n=1 Tax=Paenibacillus sp. GCM10028914 TaxID=3273416 RepID=UPI0036D3F7CD